MQPFSRYLLEEITLNKTDALLQVRQDARHGHNSLTEGWIRRICRANGLQPHQVRAAERQGRELRAKGVPCMCSHCGFGGNGQIEDRERIRIDYAAARREQLAAAGMPYDEREQTIQTEIDAGAAFQALPISIKRSAS
ncbi:hypothetical protein DR66_2552 [Delftia acidovorans]|jgi:hypothetical protein|uniref:hypothetical protein n=1 Tax=Delftia TaxID=80865 RepID=UPI000508255A|nr:MULTISPECIES: hypothetical protein [Delftia]KFJ11341.1 hypothetical protein DR66_2552 [Delftia acidovorans]